MTPQHLEVIETKTIRPFKYPRLALDGYLYHFHKKCTHHLRWKCNRVYSLKCPAVLRTNMDKYELEHIAVDHEHVHGPDFIAIEALKARINVHKQSSLFNQNTCFKQKNLDAFFEEIDLPEIIKNNPVRFCASSKEIFFTDPLDPDYKNGNTEKYDELIKNNDSKDAIFNFENYPFNKLEQKDNKNQIGINLKDGIMKNHTSYSFNEELKNVNQICQATSPNEHNMTVNNQKNNTQQNKRALLTNTHEKKNTSTTNTYKKISHFTTNARKVKNSLITNIKKKLYTLTNNKYSLRNNKNKRNYILSKNNQIEKNMLISKKRTLKRSLITNTNKRKNVKITNKQKNKSTLITNACRQIIPSKVKLRKYTSKFINQNSPIIINTITTTSTSTIKSTPTIISTPKILSTPTIENATEIISTPKVTSQSTVNSLPSIKITHNMMERCLNKNINNENESISDSDDNNDDGDSSFGFDEANCNAVIDDDDEETNIKIKKLKLVQEDYMYHILYSKKNWSTILKKLSDPLTGIKVFENILLIKVLIRIMKGNNRTKRQVHILKSRNDHWKLKFDCLEHKIKTLVNSTRSDRNLKCTSVLNKKAKDTTLCTNIEVHKQINNFGLKKKVSTELKSNVTLENLKTSKLYQYFNSQNNFLSKCGSDIMTSKSEEIKTNISSTPVMVDLIKDIPANVIISRLSPKPFDTKQNNLTQSDSDIKMIQSKFIKSNENFSPVSCISKALKLSSKSLKRKIFNLIQNNTSIEIKSKFRKYNEFSSLASNDLIMESLPDIMVSRFGPKLLNSQITNSTQHNTAINMTESNINKYYESFTPASIDVIVNNLPIIINSRLIGEKNIFTQFNKHTEIIPSISISNDLNSDVPTFSSSSMRAVTSLNDNLLFNKEINPALSMFATSNVEVLVFEKNLEISTKDSKMINYKEWKSPRKLTVRSETDPSMGTTVILPFALKRLSKLNNHSPSQYPMLNKLLTKPNTILKLDKRDKLNTPLIPVQMKTPLPDVVYESTQIMNKINFKETIQTNHSYDHQISPNLIKSVPKAIPLPSPEIINDFSNEAMFKNYKKVDEEDFDLSIVYSL